MSSPPPSAPPSPLAPADPPAKEKLTQVPLWIPVSAFVGTSLALGLPLLLLRRRGPARRSLSATTPPPPPRRALHSAALPPPAPAPTVPAGEPVLTSLRAEIETPSAGEMMGALAKMNASSAKLAAQAFGLATVLVALGGGALAWGVRTTMDVHDVREFGAKMRYLLWKAAPELTARIHRAPETDDERRALDFVSLSPTADAEAWSWPQAQRRLQAAYDAGGFALWAQMAVREVEAEARAERAKREREFGTQDAAGAR